MMPLLRALLLLSGLVALCPAPAAAQPIQDWDCRQFTWEQIDEDRIRLMRQVECNGSGPNAGQQIFADELVWNTRTGELEASGNVLLVSPTARLAAERMVFNTKTGLGTFYTASGSASLGERGLQDKSMFGTLEPDLYFMGERIDKIGEERYRLTNGRFTTCVQPTPRWEVVTGSATIELEDYAVLRNAVIRVKDVPLFYLPILYYPIQSDDRATGFLLPSYGTSTFRGQSLSNAFFWAVNRSQDVTLMHDWFAKTGQGFGTEYRYVMAPGSEGTFRAYRLMQNQTEQLAAENSYELRGSMAHLLPGGFRARGYLDYFSSLAAQQLYNTDLYYASRRQRTIGGSVTGAWGGVSITGNYQHSELFHANDRSTVNGYAPSITANVASRRLGRLPVYLSVSSEAAKHIYINRVATTERDASIGRLDLQPTVRAALTRWPFLGVNASVGFRSTYYTESLDEDRVQVPIGLSRRYFDLRAEVTGPTFSRVFRPNNAIAERMKHVIEPSVTVQRVTSFPDQARVPQVGNSYDYVIGGTTRVNYALANRVLVRRTAPPGAPARASAPRELLSVTVMQSYYTDPEATRYDVTFQSGLANRNPRSHFSPLAIIARTSPTAYTTGMLRMEFDPEDLTLRNLHATGSSTYSAAQVSVGWSTRNYAQSLRENTINTTATFNLLQGRTGGRYALDWDITRNNIMQQRWTGFYNAQCCGIAFEYQQFNFATGFGLPQDRRFNMSFTLAGVGTFSNFFGAFGGGGGRF